MDPDLFDKTEDMFLRLEAERDALRAKLAAAECQAETMRKALEQIGGPVPPNGWACLWCGDGSAEDDCAEDCPRAIAILALATTPAMSLAAVQAEAIEEKEAENGR